MDAYQPSSGENSFDIPPLMNQPPQFFGANAPGSPGLGTGFSASFFPDDVNGGSVEENNEAKRRRIARVRVSFGSQKLWSDTPLGMRHVPQEEDQV